MDEKIKQLTKDLKLIKELQASDIYTENYQEARALFSLGYRKESDTAREILSETMKIPVIDGKFVKVDDFIEKIKDIAKEKYGVDLGE